MTRRIFAMVSTNSSKRYTPLAIESFFNHSKLTSNESLIVIDNDRSLIGVTNNEQLSFVAPPEPRSFAENFNWILTKAAQKKADIYFLNNDIIFTPDWLLPLEPLTHSIVTPVSNREFQYRRNGLRLDRTSQLDEYLANEDQLNLIVQYHRRKNFNPTQTNRRRVLSLPFFCVKVPVAVWSALGSLDESFGKGGAEDNDYCLRAYLAGFSVEYALDSYLLHFSGKSTWDGAESADETRKRDELYRSKFQEKWGEALMQLSIFGDLSPVIAEPSLIPALQTQDFGTVIAGLRAGEQVGDFNDGTVYSEMEEESAA